MFLNRLLGFDASSMKMRTEVVAGSTTFLTMCYILAVNPAVLSIWKSHSTLTPLGKQDCSLWP